MKDLFFVSFLKRNKHFSLLWLSQLFSQITINMVNFVMATRIYEKTGSTLAVSFLWIFYFIPSFFLGPFSGYFVDLWKKRSILIITNLFQSLAVLFFLVVGEKIYLIFPIVFLYSLLNQFYVPAEAASVPGLVKKKDLPLANSLFLLTAQLALVTGFGTGGVLMRFLGREKPMAISSFLLFLAAVAVYFLPRKESKLNQQKQNITNFINQIKKGYLFIKQNNIILFPLLLIVVFQIFLTILAVSVPAIADKIVGIQVQDAGPLLIVPLGLGALVGTSIVSRLSKKVRKKTLVERGLLVSAMVFFFLSMLVPLFQQYKTLITAPLIFILGIFSIYILIPNQTIVQEKTPAIFRGRVFGTLGFMVTAATLPFLLLSATITELLGIKLLIFIFGISVLILYFAMKKYYPVIIFNGRKNEKYNYQ